MNEAKTLSQTIGEKMRELREGSGLLQENIAATARKRYGVRWTRATIAAIETGKRRLTVEELIMLPMILTFSHLTSPDDENKFLELPDLIPSEGWVVLSPQTSVHVEFVSAVLQGKAGKSFPAFLDTPELRKIRAILPKVQEKMQAWAKAYDKLRKAWPEVKVKLEQFDNELASDAVRKVAIKLRTSPMEVVFASHGLWNKSLEEERDGRISQRAEGRDMRTIQALRGHVTRSLLKDLKAALNEKSQSKS